ncbi:MAG: MotA/TolQ/ExbB proton channel family protein [Candidatus Eisenbacteria bacterium]|uniref:MotA/TolQ/ExbB proton channel family protein n=1 Tax=Eiseniibacteriota bacterium TaxID=2212470 RepID=A0A937XD35_UNCEI|nr:MotA/TolQ/ExbB proton channel family protein [Candidatus Eisenbacteria bacterium]
MLDVISKGGVLMLPIILCSIVALAIIIERLVLIARARRENDRFLEAIRGRVRPGKLEEALAICRVSTAAPLATVFLEGLRHIELGEQRTREAIVEAGERETLRLENHLGGLQTIAGGAPLLGFLGTVLGMIAAFQRIEQLGGNVDASVLAGGIWQALLTTAAGLTVAVPAYFAHNYIVSRVHAEVLRMEDHSSGLMLLLTTGRDPGGER